MPENLVSRDGFGSPIPRQPAHLHTQAESGVHLRDSSRVPRRRPFIYLNRHTPSGQSRVYRVTQLRTDGVHCREFAGTGPVNLKVVPETGATLAGHHGPINMRLSFPHPLSILSGHVGSTGGTTNIDPPVYRPTSSIQPSYLIIVYAASGKRCIVGMQSLRYY